MLRIKFILVIFLGMIKNEFFNSKVVKNLEDFKNISDVIVANRMENILEDVKDKVYTRDIFNSDD